MTGTSSPLTGRHTFDLQKHAGCAVRNCATCGCAMYTPLAMARSSYISGMAKEVKLERCLYSLAMKRMCWPLSGGALPTKKFLTRSPGTWMCIATDATQRRYLQEAPGQALPPLEGRLRCDGYDPVAVQRVSWALGHN